jgi:probable HAF family extracellular repeat protein
MKPYLPILLATLVVITIAPAAATASDQYRTIDLGSLGGDFSFATAVNNRGQVVGQSLTAESWNHAFLWSNGVHDRPGCARKPR